MILEYTLKISYNA